MTNSSYSNGADHARPFGIITTETSSLTAYNVTANNSSLAGTNATLSEALACSLVENLHMLFGGILVISLNALAVLDTCINRTIRSGGSILVVL